MAKIIIDELYTLIGFQTTKESKQAVAGVENGIRTLKKMALVATGALTGLGLAMTKIASGVDKQAKFAKSIGLTFEELQKLQFAGQKAGVSVSEMNGFLETLAKTMTSTIPGEYNKALQQLGISAKDSSGHVKGLSATINEVADVLSNDDTIRRLQFTGRLGAPSTVANFLGQGSKQIKSDMAELNKIGGLIPEKLTKQAAALVDDSLLKVRKTIKAMSAVVTLSLSPAISKLLDQFDLWIVKNQKIIAVNLGAFIKAVSRGFEEFGDIMVTVASALDSLMKKVGGSSSSFKALGSVTFVVKASLLALATAILAPVAPFLLMGAGIEGILEYLPDLNGALKAAANLFNTLLPSSVDKTTESINKSADAVERLLSIFDKFKSVKEFLNFASEKAGAPLALFNLKSAEKGLNQFSDLLRVTKPGASGELQNLVAQNEASQSVSVPFRGAGSARSTTNNVNITVNGAGSPEQVAKEVKVQFDLSTAVQTASPGFNRGLVA